MKRRFLILGLAILLPSSAAASDFAATIDSDRIEPGKSFTLKLTLSGVKAKTSPDIAALKQSFTVVSEVHSANASSTGQAVNFNVDWQLVLLPRHDGLLTIPSIAIETASGRLRTAPITLHVELSSSPLPSQVSADGSKVSISAKASIVSPYRNQPIRYTIRCVVRGAISKVRLEDINVTNAIVERQGKPNVYDQVENGVPVRVIEINYLVTPLQPGKMVIPPFVLKGEMQTPALAPMIDPFGGQFMLSPRAQQAMAFFSAYGGEPFAIASNETVLDVKPSVGAMDPWLPLRSLKITEAVDASQPTRVGDQVTRKIKLLAEGVVGTQLPDLEAQQNHEDFGVYADKPTTGEDVDSKTGTILGWRNESYSLIPQRAGRLVLPAVKVAWWDIANKKVATAQLPERAVIVLPSAAIGKARMGSASSADEGGAASVQSIWARILPSGAVAPVLYALAGALAAVLLFFAFWVYRLQRRTAGAKPRVKRLTAARTLKQIRTVEGLRDFLQVYAQERLGKSAGTSLEQIFSPPPTWWKEKDRANVTAVIKDINATLYAGRPADVDDLKRRSQRVVIALRSGADGNRKNNEQLPLLNPS